MWLRPVLGEGCQEERHRREVSRSEEARTILRSLLLLLFSCLVVSYSLQPHGL